MFKSLIVPVDGSQPSNAAIDLAVSLAKSCGSSITLCRVLHVPRPVHDAAGFAREEIMEEERHTAHAVLDEGKQRVAAAGQMAEAVVQTGSVAEGVLDEARRRGCDAVVMGSRGHGGMASALLGSKTQDVISRSHIPVIVAPHVRS